MVNLAVTLLQRGRGNACLLELPVDIAGEHGATQRHVFTPSIQYPESDMRLRFTIQLEAMPVKTPCSLRVGAEGFGAGNAVEINLRPPKRWVRLPKSVFASKVGQPGIDAYSRACGHYQRVGL